jgi:predicted nucleic acid-binding protein
MVLDTSICIDLMRESARGVDGPARLFLGRLGHRQLYLSWFSLCELHTGIFLGDQGAAEEGRIMSLVDHLTIINPDQGFPGLYGEAAAALIRKGTPIPVMDLLIGITAKSRSMPILTRDPVHFRKIPGLIVETY